VPRDALSVLLDEDDDDGLLVYTIVIEDADPGQVARERGVSQVELLEQLRDAIDGLACEYEDIANESLGKAPRSP
jgi:hypothetical protein